MIELDDLLQATGGALIGETGERQFTELAFDSRRLVGIPPDGPKPLFVAVKSDTGDGHDFILEAVQRGAGGVLCQRLPTPLPSTIPLVLVDDTRQALLDWARHILAKTAVPVIAVTGSRGKTVTKEAIAAVLGARFAVFKNPRSYSGRYGLPIALGRLDSAHQLAVLELAADSLNEIYDLSQLTQPQISVLTTIDSAHIDNLGSLQAIAHEKGHAIEALPDNGWAVLNRDDPRVWSQQRRTTARVIGFGVGAPTDPSPPHYSAEELHFAHRSLSFTLVDRTVHPARRFAAQTRLMGRHHLYAALAAVAVGRIHRLPIADILAALSALPPQPGRLCPLDGRKGSILLDDSYDAEESCTLAALDAIEDHYPGRRRIVVLGGIQQPSFRTEAINHIAERAAQVADLIVLKGDAASALHHTPVLSALSEQQLFITYTNAEAVRFVDRHLSENTAVLIKGTREERLEHITRGLMASPRHAPELLVRQETAFQQVQMALPSRPTVIKVDLAKIAGNLGAARRIIGPDVRIMAVLKADGYGHGAIRIARTAVNNGADMLGVACLSEGIALRQAGITAPVLVLGYTPAWHARQAVLNDIALTLFDLDTARALNQAAGQVGRSARVHVKVDTGMGRLGLLPSEALSFVQSVHQLPRITVEGVFTHFSTADDADKTYTYHQLDLFREVVDLVRGAGLRTGLVHAANSAALFSVPEARFDMVRLGIALYGLAPSSETPLPDGFAPALTFETRIAQVKQLPPGSYVSYGNTYRTPSTETIAVIPVGYADGFRRAPAHWGHVLVKGRRAPIVGRVCMDQTMINVTHIPGVRQGDPVVLIGQQGMESITVEQVAQRLGTINYEVISEILARVPRVS